MDFTTVVGVFTIIAGASTFATAFLAFKKHRLEMKIPILCTLQKSTIEGYFAMTFSFGQQNNTSYSVQSVSISGVGDYCFTQYGANDYVVLVPEKTSHNELKIGYTIPVSAFPLPESSSSFKGGVFCDNLDELRLTIKMTANSSAKSVSRVYALNKNNVRII